jgi:hypothetical protein
MEDTNSNCVYRYCQHRHVHILTLQNGSIAAVDDGLAHLTRILDEHPENQTLHLLVDVRAGIPPLTYFLRELHRTYHSQESVPPLRIVYLYQDNLIPSALSPSFAALPVNAIRHAIHNGTKQDAIDWLTTSSH